MPIVSHSLMFYTGNLQFEQSTIILEFFQIVLAKMLMSVIITLHLSIIIDNQLKHLLCRFAKTMLKHENHYRAEVPELLLWTNVSGMTTVQSNA